MTFKRHYDYNSGGSGFQTNNFNHFPRPIKVHWRCICKIPYALVSVNKEISEIAVSIFKFTHGVDKVIPYTEAKERNWDMWDFLRIM